MNHEKLSERLHQVALHIPKESVLADIGSDHAYLPCYSVSKGIAKKAIAGEISDGPFNSASDQVKSTGLEQLIEVRKGDGLEVIEPNEVTCITIAGMGGALITSILEKGKAKLEGVTRLILQPNVGAEHIRKWLIDHGWELKAEEILEEDKKIYEILVAEKGDPLKPYGDNPEAGIVLGPLLLLERNKVFGQKWTYELEHWKNVLKQMENSSSSEASIVKRNEIRKLIKLVEEALA